MASREKKPPLHEIDLAVAATLPESERKRYIEVAISGHGFDRYKSSRELYPEAFNGPSLFPRPSLDELKRRIDVRCQRSDKAVADGNKAIISGAYEFADARGITYAPLSHQLINLGRAGMRLYWHPCLLKIGKKTFLPFFDHRLQRGLTPDAMKFIFSINHAHFREADPARFGDIGLVIFQYDKPKYGRRRILPFFERNSEFWSLDEIGAKIDAAYRTLGDIRRAA